MKYKKIQDAFVGKICTILTSTIAKTNFSDQQFADFFTGVIESIDEDGIFTKHTLTGCSNYYTWNNVVGILEEQVVYDTNPEYENIMKEVKKEPDTNPFVNPDVMADMAKQAKEIQNKMLRKN